MGNTQGKPTQSGRKKAKKQEPKYRQSHSRNTSGDESVPGTPEREAICTPSRCERRIVYEHEEFTTKVVQDQTCLSVSVHTTCTEVSSTQTDSSPSTSSPHSSDTGQSTSSSWLLTRQQSVNAQAAMASPPLKAPHYEATSGTINFCLLARILLDVCSDAMRDLLRCKIKGGEVILTQKIYQKRNKLNKLPYLHDAQKKLILPQSNELVRYHSLDFSLMYTIMRNVCPFKIEPDARKQDKWGKPPDDNDFSLLAALERLRKCRNDFFAHNSSAKVDDTVFNEIWLHVEEAVKKIDENLDPSIVGICYLDEMKKLKENPNIDPNTTTLFQRMAEMEKRLMEAYEVTVETDIKLEELLSIRKKYRKTIWGFSKSKLHVDLNRHEDPNIAQTEHYLARFVKENQYYVETRVFQEVEKFLKLNKCAIIVGKPGTGKTEIAIHLMFKNFKDFVVCKLNSPHEFRSLVNPKKKQMFFIDNVFECSDNVLVDWWKSFEYIQELVGSKSDHQTLGDTDDDHDDSDAEGPELITYVVMTTRPYALNVAKKKMRKNQSLLKNYVLNIDSEHFTLSNKEKRWILEAKVRYASHVKKIEEHTFSEIEWRNIFQSCPPFGYPLCARLFACDKRYRKDGPEFFSNPHRYLVSRLKEIIEDDISRRTEMLFVLLLVCEIQNISLQYDDDDQCWEILSDLKLTQELSLTKAEVENLPEAASDLLEKYLRETEKHAYKFIHPSVREAVENYFIEKYTKKAIEILPMHILFKKMNLEDYEDTCLPALNPDLLESLAGRLLQEIVKSKGNLCEVCKYDGFKNKNFSIVFLKQITKDAHCFQELLKAEHIDGFPFIYWFTSSACQDTVLELIKHELLIEICSDSEIFLQCAYALMASCALEEKMQITEYILERYSNKDIQNFCRERKCSAFEESIHEYVSPLREALRSRNEEAIRLLIGKKAIFSFTRWSGWPFLHACYKEPQICCSEMLEAILAFDRMRLTLDRNDMEGALNYNQILAQGEKTFHEDVVTNIDNSISEHGSHERILLNLVKIPTLEVTNGLIDAFCSLSEIRKYSEMKRQNPLNITDDNGNSILHLLMKFKVYHPKNIREQIERNDSIHQEDEGVNENKDEKLTMYPEEVTTEDQHDVAYEQMENQSILLQTIGRLYVKGIDINMKNENGETPLMIEISKFSPSIEAVESLLHYRANPNAQDIIGRTCLHTLLLQNYDENVPIECYLELLIKHGADINKTDEFGNNPIFVELKRQKPRATILKILIDAQIDLRVADMLGQTALQVALSSTYDEEISKEDIIRILLKSNCLNVLLCDKNGLSAFRFAMENENYHDILVQIAKHDSCPFPLHSCILEDVHEHIKIQALMHLISNGDEKVEISTKDQDDRTLLITAVQKCPNMVILLNFLLTTNIDINAKDTYGKNALFYLISSDTEFSIREAALNLLLAKGPSVHDDLEDKDSMSPLSLAMQFMTSRSFLFESLDPLEFPSEAMTKKMTTEESPKKHSIKREDVQSDHVFDLKVEIVQKILDIATVNLNFPVDEKQRTYLHYCASSRLADEKTHSVCERLVRLGVDVDKRDKDGLTCIDMAFRYSVKNFDTLVFLLETSTHLKELDIDELLEFTTAKTHLYYELVRYLQQNIFHRITPKRNLFHYLASICYDPKNQAKAERDKVFDCLLKSFSIDQKSKTRRGQIPLHVAIEENASVSCVRSFVRISKCCINTPDSEGNTALHLVLKSGRDDTDVCTIVQKMLKCNAAVDVQNDMLETPIMLAVCCPEDRTSTITELLKANANLFLTDRREYTVLHHCVGAPKNDIAVCSLLSLFIDGNRAIPVMEKNADGLTPLNLAAKTKTFSRILCILKLFEVKQCTAVTVDRQGRSLLYNVAFSLEGVNPLIILERLLRGYIFLMHGDSASVKNNKGTTVYDVCNEYGHISLGSLLESEKSEKMFEILKQAWIDVSSQYLIFDKNDNDPKLQFRSNVEERFRDLISDSLPFLSHVNFDDIKNVELIEEENNLSSVPDLEQGHSH